MDSACSAAWQPAAQRLLAENSHERHSTLRLPQERFMFTLRIQHRHEFVAST